mmetsp:Transcript_14108/g.30384  ORF Transcript_14108/g.30384 Transcript_14108/m.30384 type:complete len:249 (+) Transcript_14108:316-1062(+)
MFQKKKPLQVSSPRVLAVSACPRDHPHRLRWRRALLKETQRPKMKSHGRSAFRNGLALLCIRLSHHHLNQILPIRAQKASDHILKLLRWGAQEGSFLHHPIPVLNQVLFAILNSNLSMILKATIPRLLISTRTQLDKETTTHRLSGPHQELRTAIPVPQETLMTSSGPAVQKFTARAFLRTVISRTVPFERTSTRESTRNLIGAEKRTFNNNFLSHRHTHTRTHTQEQTWRMPNQVSIMPFARRRPIN